EGSHSSRLRAGASGGLPRRQPGRRRGAGGQHQRRGTPRAGHGAARRGPERAQLVARRRQRRGGPLGHGFRRHLVGQAV
ncbi:MAG: hypothetical protein AVDCRST_MAG89-4219, partial [uncultured Gemmatimonadetes bacterium]